MTDEMIQQIPQQSGSYATSGFIGGAAIGGVAGAAGAHYKNWGITTKPDLDKVFAQDPDTFKRQIERGGDNKGAWETAQEWVNKIKDSDAEYDKKVAEIKEANTIAVDKDLEKKLEQAKKDYNTAFEAEKKSIEKTVKSGEFKFPTAEDVKNLGDKVKLEEVNEYNKLLTNYQKALEKAEATADRTTVNTFKTNVVNHLEGIDNISKQPKGFFARMTKKDALKNKVDLIKTEIETIYPDITDAKRINHELKVAGKDYKPGSKNYKKFVNHLNEQVRKDRENLLKEILGEEIQVDVIDPKTKKVIGKRTTYSNVETYVHELEAANNRIAKFERRSEVKKLGGLKALLTVEEYDKALKDLEKNKSKMTVGNYDAAKSQLETAKHLAQDFEKINNSISNRINNFFGRISQTKILEDKVQKSINNNPQVQSTLQKLRNFAEKNEAIKEIAFNAGEEGTLSAEEIAKRATENLSKEKVATDLEALKKQAEEKGTELTEKGKKLIEELGSKENYSSKVKEDAKKAIEPLLDKMKFANKTYTGLAAGAVLAIAGLLVGSSMKKDA